MLQLKNIYTRAGEFKLRDISIDIDGGDYHILLGPSGSGKTVLLETIAGFRQPDSGKILLHNKDITNLKARDRKTGLLFQDYALFPHLSVYENIAYSMKIQKVNHAKIREKVEEMAGIMDIKNLLNRETFALSGGEKQRVALSRILVHEPDVLLLDEPLSSVDAELFRTIRQLLRSINKRGQTILHVTHNYEEAVSLANKISVIDKGSIIQTGNADELLNSPKNSFVATFTGIRNIYPVKLVRQPGTDEISAIINGQVRFEVSTSEPEGDYLLYIRSEDISISSEKLLSSARNNFKGIIKNISRTGNGYELVTDIGIPVEIMVTVTSFDELKLTRGKEIWISFKASSVRIF